MKLKGYAPDLSAVIEGILTNCAAAVPSLRGMEAAPAAASSGLTVLAATCQGAAVLTKLDSSTRLFAATGTNLYEAQSPNWTVRSGKTYTASATQRWRYAQFGDVSLAVNANDTLQASASSAFADVSGAPSAGVVETVGQFVFLFDTNDGTYGISPDRWRCAAIGTHDDWTPAVATQAATGRLTSSPGKIVGAKRFGNAIVAFKRTSMYLGIYVAPPVIWEFTQLPVEFGALSQEAIVNVGTDENPKLIWMGYDDFYAYDGSKPVPIGGSLRETVFGQLLRSRDYLCAAQHDRANGRVYFHYPSSDSLTPDKCVVYNYKTDQWGVDDRTIEVPVEFITPGVTYDALGDSYSTYADLPTQSYDAAFLSQSLAVPGVFDTTHELKTLTGTAGSSSITTGDVGDDFKVQTLSRVRPRFLTKPTTANLTNSYRMSEGETLTSDAAVSLASNGFFDTGRSARWHRMLIEMTGDWEMGELFPELIEDGSE